MLPKLSPRQHEIVMSLVGELRRANRTDNELAISWQGDGTAIRATTNPASDDAIQLHSQGSFADWESLEAAGLLHMSSRTTMLFGGTFENHYMVLLEPALGYYAHYGLPWFLRIPRELWWAVKGDTRTVVVAAITAVITTLITKALT